MEVFFGLLLVLQLGKSIQENPCDGMSLGHCDFDDQQVLARNPFDLERCLAECRMNSECKFWRHNQAMVGTSEECLFLNYNYHTYTMRDCTSFISDIPRDFEECKTVDDTTCDAILDEECEFSGQRLYALEPGFGHIGSIKECIAYGNLLHEDGVDHIVFIIETEDCQLFSTFTKDCFAKGGPPRAPSDCS